VRALDQDPTCLDRDLRPLTSCAREFWGSGQARPLARLPLCKKKIKKFTNERRKDIKDRSRNAATVAEDRVTSRGAVENARRLHLHNFFNAAISDACFLFMLTILFLISDCYKKLPS
jgi:hypothetical protein